MPDAAGFGPPEGLALGGLNCGEEAERGESGVSPL